MPVSYTHLDVYKRQVMEYCHYYLPRIADQETVNHICTEVDKWMNLNTLSLHDALPI